MESTIKSLSPVGVPKSYFCLVLHTEVKTMFPQRVMGNPPFRVTQSCQIRLSNKFCDVELGTLCVCSIKNYPFHL